jgi:integrase/recombinase XerD
MIGSRLRPLNLIKDQIEKRTNRILSLGERDIALPEETTFDEFDVENRFVCAYLDARAGTQLTESSVKTYESRLREYTKFLQRRSTSVLDAELTDIIEYVEWCVERGNRQSTIEGKLTVVIELYKFLSLRTDASGILTINPIKIERIDLFDYNTPIEIQREALTREEVRRLFDAMESYRNRLIAIVAIETGIRNSDLRNLRLRDIDLDDCTLHIQDPKNGKPYEVPISQELSIELEIWRDEYREAYGNFQQSRFLFPGHRSEKIGTNGWLNRIIKRAAEDAGIQDVIATSNIPEEDYRREWYRVTVHTLRHTCLTLMKEDGVPLRYRQLIANHSSPSTTQHYSHGPEQEFNAIRDRYRPPR